MTARAFLAFALVALGARAEAHPAPFSYLDLHLGPSAVEGSLVMHVIDVAHDLGIDPPARLLDGPTAAALRPRIVGLPASRLAIVIAGQARAPEWGDLVPLPERQALRLFFRIPVASPSELTVHARLFPYDPYHQTFLNVYDQDVLRQQAILDRDHDARTYYAGNVPGRMAVLRTFVPAGIRHILIGPDHVLFLVGLLLLGGGWRALVRIVTAFTLGHSVTLSLAALGVVSPPARVVEPAIALSIVFVGVDNLLVGSRGRDLRAWVALAFGFVHGFGFASVLREFGLPREALGWSLFSFNFGVEIGQLVIVAVVALALAAVRRRNEVLGQRLAVAGSLAVIAAGGYWFVQRLFLAGGAS